MQAGGKAYFARNNALIESVGEAQRTLADTSMLPVVMNGAAEFQIGNLLAAIAACRAFGVEQDVLLKSLISFSSWANNPGRANLYRLNGGHVMVDYGHNTQAFDAICRLSQGDRFDLTTVRPAQMKGRAAEKLPERKQEEEMATA